MAELKRRWPFGLFPLLVDDGEPVVETKPIIEHLQAQPSGPQSSGSPMASSAGGCASSTVFSTIYVMNNMTESGNDALRPEGSRDPFGAAKAWRRLRTAYDWLEENLVDGPWAVGEAFTLADCAAAPSLFYADWLEEIGPERPRLWPPIARGCSPTASSPRGGRGPPVPRILPDGRAPPRLKRQHA